MKSDVACNGGMVFLLSPRAAGRLHMKTSAMLSYRSLFGSNIPTTKARPLSHWERVGVREYGLSLGRNPSPGATRRPLPKGEVAELVFCTFVKGQSRWCDPTLYAIALPSGEVGVLA